jgi:hypothetical protein
MKSCDSSRCRSWRAGEADAPVDGYVTAPEASGLGIDLREEPFRNGDAVIETIAEV